MKRNSLWRVLMAAALCLAALLLCACSEKVEVPAQTPLA